MRLGAHILRNGLFVAPMAGVTDRPFRTLCRRFGAGLAVSEMVSARAELRGTRKSRLRLEHEGEPAPVAVQILGADPALMAEAARYNVDQGAQIIDINMGCPAKKVCQVAAGSALLEDEALVARILERVVTAVSVPVTLKIRTGPDPARRNAPRLARIAETAGVQLLAIHGRTRACGFTGAVEYDSIAAAKAAVRIPVIANGEIASAGDARRVLALTGADGVMIGRAAHGRPWIFREIEHELATGTRLAPPAVAEMRAVVLGHLEALYALYGEPQGVRVARKHIGWYLRALPRGEAFRREVNGIESAAAQLAAVRGFFERLAQAANDARDGAGARAA
ncbi:MAG: tRNA dihydrouridine synthase DusB [Betaproteobacteria bacterium]|nr:MAG: tRNA dihydrouridine synthase DusB [Betaproteobacteria bacterium]